MSDRQEAGPPAPDIQTRRRFSLVWAIPVVALLVAGFLFWRTLSQQGPTVDVTFLTADGLTAGQTKVRHKAVDLGTVERIDLSPDMSHVIVGLRMRADASQVLTDHANFWVVRARLTPGNISGLETIVSGSFIELDPGRPGGSSKREFKGLETPPAVRSDEPGRTFVINAPRIGSLSTGSQVVYRDVTVGEVLGHDEVTPGSPIKMHIFVREPYDQYVHEGSFFWNDSGFQVAIGAEGVHVELQSLQAVISGALAFDTPPEARNTPIAKPDTEFQLFSDEATGQASHYKTRLTFLVHFKGSVRGLARGNPVELFGIPVGTVRDVKLAFDPATAQVDVPVHIEIQPERFMTAAQPTQQDLLNTMQRLVDNGLRAQLTSANLLTGQLVVSLNFLPNVPAARVTLEGQDIVLPSQPGGLDSIMNSVTDIADKLKALPLAEIGNNINLTLKAVSGLASGSQFRRDLTRLLSQVSDTVRSVRLLADFLDQHPEALIRGRTGTATER